MNTDLNRADIRRILKDMVRPALAKSGGLPLLSAANLPDDISFDAPPSEFDSLALMTLAGRVNEMFHLHETGLEDNLLRYRSIAQWAEIVQTCWRNYSETLTFRTSGSTGEPRPHTHPVSCLVQEVVEIATHLSDRRRVISMVPTHHIYGFLFTVLLPRVADFPVIDGRDMGVGQLARRLEPGDLIVSFPARWAYLEQSMGQWPEGVQGVSSTGPLNPDVWKDLTQKGFERLYEVYGSSETSGIGIRQSPDTPYTLFSFWRRAYNENDADGGEALIRTLPDGETARRFPLPDALEWESERAFRPVGRRDGAVQVGGINVYPQKVAAVIRSHPNVRDCAVRLSSQTEPSRLTAFVVPKRWEGVDAFRAELERWIRERLEPAERPARLTLGDRLPVNEMGKVTDWEF